MLLESITNKFTVNGTKYTMVKVENMFETVDSIKNGVMTFTRQKLAWVPFLRCLVLIRV